MVVSALLVNTFPEKLEKLKVDILQIHGTDISNVIDNQVIVVIVDSKIAQREAEVSKLISNMEGVLGINVAYHHYDGEEDK